MNVDTAEHQIAGWPTVGSRFECLVVRCVMTYACLLPAWVALSP